MTPPFDIITFDCYGTLIDWETGITGAFREAAAANGVQLDDARVLQAHAELEPAVQAAGYRRYRDVLAEVALETARLVDWKLTPGRAGFLADSLASWQPFPDTNAALERLRELGCRLGILSNIDDDLLAGTLDHFTVEFDLLVTAEQVGSYKPAHGHFLEARKRIGRRRWLHAARSYFHDVVPATALDIPMAWVNRNGEPPSGAARPDVEVGDLHELVEWVSGEPGADSR